MKNAVLAAFLIAAAPMPVAAGPIDTACVRSNRAANPVLCTCIQRVANLTLTGPDQRLAAKFFQDPGRAQEVRQSTLKSHRQFWERYTAFGEAAEQVCAQ